MLLWCCRASSLNKWRWDFTSWSRCFWLTILSSSQVWKVHRAFFSKSFPFRSAFIRSVLNSSFQLYLCSWSLARVVPSPGPVYFCARLSARCLAQYRAFTCIDKIIPALATVAPFDFNRFAPREHASVPLSIQVSNKLAVADNFSGLSVCSNNYSHHQLLNNTKIKLDESKIWLKDGNIKKEVLLNTIRFL